MSDLLSNYEQEIEFVTGFAGSGKSTELAKRFNGSRAIVLTPTHKAKEVLLAKGVQNVATIHSLLKLVPTLNMNMRKGMRMQRLQRIGAIDLKSMTHIGIDEFSMINTEIMDLLLELLPTHCKVTVFGDPYQLEPIDGAPVEPDYYTDKITELTTQHRAEALEVVETFMRFMDYIKSNGDPRIDLRLNPKIEIGSISGFNLDTDRALAYTNQAVLDLNDKIAEHLKLPKEISMGEQIFINGLVGQLVEKPEQTEEEILTIYPKCVSKGKLMMGDKLIGTIEHIEEEIEQFNTDISMHPIAYIEIEEEVYSFHLDLDHYTNAKALKGYVEEAQFSLIDEHNLDKDVDLKEWCYNNRGKKYVRERGRAWSKYLAHQGLIWDMRRPFATTIHKSQGQEFSTVYIAQDDIKKVIRGKYYMKYARLMYVALSRAMHKVIIVK